MLIVACAILTVGLLTALELRWPARTEPAPRALNLALWAARLGLQLTVMPMAGLLAASAGVRLGWPCLHIDRWPLLWSAPALLLASDLAEYLYHRAQHAIPWLWRRHALHHSDPCVSATTTERHWWGDLPLKALVFGAPLAVLLRPSAQDYGLYAAASLWNYLAHANLRIDFGGMSWALNCPAYHRLHHARAAEHHGANYAALLPIFDVIAGSYRRPRDFLESGLEPAPRRFLEALAWPPAEAPTAPGRGPEPGSAAACPSSGSA